MYGCSGSCTDSDTIHIDSILSHADYQGPSSQGSQPANREQMTDFSTREKRTFVTMAFTSMQLVLYSS